MFESLELWYMLVSNAPALTPELRSLFAYWEDLVAFHQDHMAILLNIAKSYALFNDAQFMQVRLRMHSLTVLREQKAPVTRLRVMRAYHPA
jgi:hypothetical protein